MVKIDFDEALKTATNIQLLSNDFNHASSSCNSIDVSRVSSFSPGTASTHSEIQSVIRNLSNIANNYHSNYLYGVNKYKELFELIAENISKMLKNVTYKASEISKMIHDKIKKDGYYIIGPAENSNMLRAIVLDKYGNERIILVANTKINCFEYSKFVMENGVYQNDIGNPIGHGIAGGDCLMLCKYYAIDMLSGTFTDGDFIADDNRRNARGSESRYGNRKEIKAPRDENTPENIEARENAKKEIKEFIYQELSAGRPVVLQVTQENSAPEKGGHRHFVVITGFDESVKGPEDLNPDTMYSLDCLDGKLNFLSNSGNQPNGRDMFCGGDKGVFKADGAAEVFLNDPKEGEVYGGRCVESGWLDSKGFITINNKDERLDENLKIRKNYKASK